MFDRQKVINIALSYVGYLEKKSNSQLDDFTANAGKNNYTKFARDLDLIPGFFNGRKNGYAWCAAFVCACFVYAFDVDGARKLLNLPTKSLAAGCPYFARYFRNKGQFHTANPQKGDVIFFGKSGSESHVGLVYDVDATYVYTVEGNTSGASGVVANGGGVFKKKYKIGYSKIAGYGRPNFGDAPELAKPSAAPVYNGRIDTVREVQTWLNAEYKSGLEVDNIYGRKTKAALVRALQKNLGVTVDGEYGEITNGAVRNLRKGSGGELVKILQALLVCHGYPAAYVDGDFGSGTERAVKDYQAANGLEVDGIAGKNTFSSLCR